MTRLGLAWILAALCLVPASLASDAPTPEPLGQEDVVRMFVTGKSTDELLDAIASRPPDFDISKDMLAELRHVGLPNAVIDAMVARQREADAASAPETPEDEPEAAADDATPKLRIHVQGSLNTGDQVDPQIAAELELGNAPEDRVFADLAIFVACTTSDHVPDQWRSKSPLGRDFISMPRHRILEFIGGAKLIDKKLAAGGMLELELPDHMDVALERHVMHDLVIGTAMQVGGRYYRSAAVGKRGVLVEDEDIEMTVKFRGGRRGLKVEIVGEKGEGKKRPPSSSSPQR
jgi:hypothetical protein